MSLRELKRITVTVTPADISAGYPNDSDRCPIALALYRTFPRLRRVAVGYPRVWLAGRNWTMDPHAAEFVRRFDARQTVEMEPFKVKLVKEG